MKTWELKNIRLSMSKQPKLLPLRSLVLSNLEIGILENALQRTRQENHRKVGAWLLQIFQT